MRAALSSTPDARLDEAQVQLADARVDAARAAMLPDLSLAGGFTMGTGNVVAGGIFPPQGLGAFSGPPTAVDGRPGWQSQAGLGARWDIIGLVARLREVDVALAETQAVDARASLASLDRAWAAGAAWLAAAEADAALQAAEVDLQTRRRLAASAEALAAAGTRSAQEHALALAAVAGAEANVARARGAADAAIARLATALRVADPVGDLGPLPTRPAPMSAEAPAVVVAEADVEAREAQVAASAARFLPRLELLAAGSVRAGSWPPTAAPAVAPNWGVGLVLDVPLLDGASRRAEVTAARSALAAADATSEVAMATVLGQRAEAAAWLRAAEATGLASQAARDASEEALRLTEARYAAGLLPWDAVGGAALALRDADLTARLALVDVVRAALLVDYAAGDLSAWMEAP
jgi:multidrug efflux system outer membrane protein